MTTNDTDTKKPKAPRAVVISGALPHDLNERAENFRWPAHMTRSELVIAAVAEYLDKHAK